jgi:hypothetical protein
VTTGQAIQISERAIEYWTGFIRTFGFRLDLQVLGDHISRLPIGFSLFAHEASDGTVRIVPTDRPQFRTGLLGLQSLTVARQEYREILRFPLGYLLLPEMLDGNLVYLHRVGASLDQSKAYVGITSRSWVARYNEHRAAARHGSPYAFHDALRCMGDRPFMFHEIMAAGLSRDAALDLEEMLVSKLSLRPLGLNEIPGGKMGMRYLASLLRRDRVTNHEWEHRQGLIKRVIQRVRDDAAIAAGIVANPRNFSRADIITIVYSERSGSTPRDIARALKCDSRRIINLLSGRTYSKITSRHNRWPLPFKSNSRRRSKT